MCIRDRCRDSLRERLIRSLLLTLPFLALVGFLTAVPAKFSGLSAEESYRNEFPMEHWVAPVSYTHLDVYKRQQETHPLYLFCDTYEDILENWKDVIGDKTVYSDSSYIFYALGKEISPMELQLVEKGSKSRDNVQFGLQMCIRDRPI